LEKNKKRTIWLDNTTYLRLKVRKKNGETFAEVIRRLLDLEEQYRKTQILIQQHNDIRKQLDEIKELLITPEKRATKYLRRIDKETWLQVFQNKLNYIKHITCKNCYSMQYKVKKIVITSKDMRTSEVIGFWVKCHTCNREGYIKLNQPIKTFILRQFLEENKLETTTIEQIHEKGKKLLPITTI